MKLLKRGARGDEVKALQKMLSESGFEVPQTGVYGAWTERAVRAYQQRNGLKSVDGIVGPETMASLSPPVPRDNPMREAPQMVAEPGEAAEPQGLPEGAEPAASEPQSGLSAMFGGPPAEPAYDPLSSPISPGSPTGRGMALRSEGQATRNAMDMEALRAGREPTFTKGMRMQEAPSDGSSIFTANSPLAAEGGDLAPADGPAGRTVASMGYDPLTSIVAPADQRTANSPFADPSVTSYDPNAPASSPLARALVAFLQRAR